MVPVPFHYFLKSYCQKTYTEVLLSFQLIDECGRVKGWVDAHEPGSGNWLKYVRSTQERQQQNVMAVQVEDQVRFFYIF
jgi:hypothetical protein